MRKTLDKKKWPKNHDPKKKSQLHKDLKKLDEFLDKYDWTSAEIEREEIIKLRRSMIEKKRETLDSEEFNRWIQQNPPPEETNPVYIVVDDHIRFTRM